MFKFTMKDLCEAIKESEPEINTIRNNSRARKQYKRCNKQAKRATKRRKRQVVMWSAAAAANKSIKNIIKES